MKKSICVFLLVLLPLVAFSESIFMPYFGTDIQKAVHVEALDNLVKGLLSKKFGADPNNVPYPKSKVAIPMFSIGLDMQFVAHKSGFTFFWNNAFLYADHATGYNTLHITAGDKMNAFVENKKNSFKNKFYVYSTEMLFGGTFRRENAFNIHFGIGFKTQITPGMVWDILRLINRDIPSSLQMYGMLAGFGGTFGFTYYFNNIVGLTCSISEFIGVGGSIVAQIDGIEEMKTKGFPKGGRALLTVGLNNNFAIKFGVSLRIKGIRGEAL